MPSDKYVSADEDNASAYLSEDTVSSWLRNHREQRADCNAIEFDDGQITYAQLSKKVGRLATGLRELGIRQRDIVAIQLPNCPEFIISYLAICSLGAVVQTLHMPYRRKELEYLLQDSNAKAVICLSSFKDYSPASIFHDVNAAKKLGLQIVTLGSSISDTHDYSDLEERDEIHRSEPQQADLPFVLLYTSGTTADPKGVIHKYDSFLGNAIVAAQELGVSESDRILSLAAFSHLYGLFTLNMTLAVGGTVILLPAFSPPAFKDVLTSLAPTCVFAAPAHFIASTKDSFVGSDELSTVRGDMHVWEITKIATAAIAGFFVLRLLRFPAPVLIGPMLGSALVHVTGVATGQLPTVFIILAQIVIGSAIGARFANFARAEIWRGVRHAAAASVLMIAVTFAAAVALAPVIGFALPSMILAFAPGGFAEMMLIGVATTTPPSSSRYSTR